MGVVVTVPAGQAPVIQVTLEAGTVPAGTQISVTGHTPGASWTVRAGTRTSDGGQVVLGDSLAPINTPVTYRVTALPAGTVLAESAPVSRPWAGRSLLTDAVGTGHVDLLWQGDDARSTDQRVTLHEVPGRPTPVAVMAPTMGAGTITLTARTDGPSTRAMAALAARPSVAVLFHNPGRCFQCVRGVCDVPLVTVMVLTGVSHARSARVDVAEREWSLKGALVGVPEPGRLVPTSTWDQLDAASLTWNQVAAMARTWDAFDRTLWQEVG